MQFISQDGDGVRKDKRTTTQIRISESLYDFVQSKAIELGISQNAVMCILLDLGKNAYLSDDRQEPSE